MTSRAELSKGEQQVAGVLWTLGEASVRQVCEAFPPERKMNFQTVQTYLRRLEAKGYLQARLEGRTRIYKPKVRPKTVIRQTVDDLVDRLFGGDALPLVRHLIEDRGITVEQIAELRTLLRELENRSDERHRR